MTKDIGLLLTWNLENFFIKGVYFVVNASDGSGSFLSVVYHSLHIYIQTPYLLYGVYSVHVTPELEIKIIPYSFDVE